MVQPFLFYWDVTQARMPVKREADKIKSEAFSTGLMAARTPQI